MVKQDAERRTYMAIKRGIVWKGLIGHEIIDRLYVESTILFFSTNFKQTIRDAK
jgi:hypothetical protein